MNGEREKESIQLWAARIGIVLALVGCFAAAIWAMCSARSEAGEEEMLHASGDKQLWHRKENIVELFGHAVVSQPGETLTADYITLDRNSRVLDAKGNCIYISIGSVIYGEEMHFNLETRTGTVVGGRVSTSKFSLSGERINKLGEGRFQTHWGEYSTCVDCPNSWSLLAEDVDMQVDGYAYMANVTTKIDDVPAIWLPYMIVPMKTRRQSGFLFPAFSVNSLNGAQIVLPYFWAINRSADMTFGAGAYTARGPRLEWEGRYVLAPRSFGQAKVYYLNDKSFVDGNGTPLPSNRFAADVSQTQELPWGFTEKLRLTEVSDNYYPSKVGDVPGSGDLSLASTASLAYAAPDFSGYVAARRYRTLINTLPDPANQALEFDPRTVQEMPVVSLTANDRQLFSLPVVAGLSMGLVNFTRPLGAFDYDGSLTRPGGYIPFGTPAPSTASFSAGVDPIREATRISVTPSLYASFRPLDMFSVVPSLKYYYYWYSFPGATAPGQTSVSAFPNVPTLNRGYLLFQTDLSTQLERIYEYPDDHDHPRIKHLIRPTLTFSWIPPATTREDSNHPFLQQIQNATANNISGYNFDDYDIVPIDNSPLTSNYFVPLGYSVNMGVVTQWIRRDGDLESLFPRYARYIEATAGESINLKQLDYGLAGQPLGRFYTGLDLSLGRLHYSHLYYFYPYVPGIKHAVSASASYALGRGVHQGLFSFDRSVTLTYNWDQHGLPVPAGQGTNNLTLSSAYSVSDYFLPTAYLSFDFVNHDFLNVGVNVQYQSPSRCWKLTTGLGYDINIAVPGNTGVFNGFNFSFDLALNISGTGYGSINDMAAAAAAPK